jgi:hypothetical protein
MLQVTLIALPGAGRRYSCDEKDFWPGNKLPDQPV